VINLMAPFFSKSRGEWGQIDWTSSGIAGMNLLLDLNAGVDPGVAIKRFEERRPA